MGKRQLKKHGLVNTRIFRINKPTIKIPPKICLLGLVLFTPIFVTSIFYAINPVSASGILSEVYLLGVGADDSNDGATSSSPVASFEKAKELLAPGGTIYLSDQITLTDSQTVLSLENSNDSDNPGTLMRHPDYEGVMISVASSANLASAKTLTLENIIIDGNRDNVIATGAIIHLGSYNTLNIDSGTTLRNNNKNATSGGAVSAFNFDLATPAAAIRTTVNINGGIIQNNSATANGGGIYVSRGTINFNSGVVKENTSGSAGGGLYIIGTGSTGTNRSTLNVGSGTIVEDNSSATYGGGIYAGAYTDVEVLEVTLRNNTSTIHGGGLYTTNSVATINGPLIEGNTAKSSGGGGGIGIGSSANVTINQAIIQNNKANNGGGVYVQGAAKLHIKQATIQNNQTTTSGGGVYVTASGSVVDIGDQNYIDQNNEKILIHNNRATAYGGGLFVNSSGKINIYSGTISNNRNDGHGGGGINTSSNGTTIMYGGIIAGNRSTGISGNGRGGGIYNSSNNAITKVLGGTIDSTNAAVNDNGSSNGIYHSAIENNTSTLEIGDAEIMASIYLGSSVAYGDMAATIVEELQNPILLYVQNAYEGRVVAVGGGDDSYELIESDVHHMLIQVAAASGTWYTKLDTDTESATFGNAILTRTPPASQLDIVFLDGINGNDSAIGSRPDLAVRTFDEARSRLAHDGNIYIVNTVTVSGTESWQLPASAYGTSEVRRYNGSFGGNALTGTMIEVASTGNLSLANIIIDGGGVNSGPIIQNNGVLNISGLIKIGVDKDDGGVYLNTDKIINIADTPVIGSRINIEDVAESDVAGRVVSTEVGVSATSEVAEYFQYLPVGAYVVPDGDNYILNSAITVTAQNLSNLIVGQALTNAKIVYTLGDGQFASTINPADFVVSNLPPGLSTGTPTRASDTTVEISVTGTPTTVSDDPMIVVLPSVIPFVNIVDATEDVPVAGIIAAHPIKHLGENVTTPVLISNTLTPEKLAVSAQIDVLNPIDPDNPNSPNPGNQTIEYAISTSNNMTSNSLSWVASGVFTHLDPGGRYYVYARSAANDSYYAGTAQVSEAITTPLEYNLSLALTSSAVSITLDAETNNTDSGDLGVLVTANNPAGYNITLGPKTEGENNNMVCNKHLSSAIIPSISSTGSLTGNTWGWKIKTATDWRTFPTTGMVIINKTAASGPNSNGAAEDNHALSFGAKIDINQEPCYYQKIMVITAISN